jgi:methyltransferase (TIGR00027 family)
MRWRLPSVTAIAVAAFRGLADDPSDPSRSLDPVAARLLPRPLGWGLAVARRARGLQGLGAAAELASAGLPAHVALRTLGIDHALREALASGCGQVVILGAGLDARAVRLPELGAVQVWEVDHPDTQRLKRARVPESPVRWVPVDFTRDALGPALDAAGHRTDGPTCWIWEGVTPYLPPEATEATLTVVAARSAPGSRLLVTYALPTLGSLPAPLRPLAHLGFRLLGEPLLGLVASEALHRSLAAHGLTVLADVGSRELAEDLGRRPPRVEVAERLVVAAR